MRKGYESITEFIFMSDDIKKSDVILIPGGSHKALIEKAAELYLAGYADYILPSGGVNQKLKDYETEWAFLKDEAMKLGVPEAAILKEDQATHTFENAQLSYEVCLKNQLPLNNVILVCKNFHARRAFITYKINFPKHTTFMVQPIVDNTGITKENWMMDESYRKKVMGEVVKIGQYFESHLSTLMA